MSTNGRWIARIGYNRKQHYLGTYDTAKDAADAYDIAAEYLFGSFAVKNNAKEGLTEQELAGPTPTHQRRKRKTLARILESIKTY